MNAKERYQKNDMLLYQHKILKWSFWADLYIQHNKTRYYGYFRLSDHI